MVPHDKVDEFLPHGPVGGKIRWPRAGKRVNSPVTGTNRRAVQLPFHPLLGTLPNILIDDILIELLFAADGLGLALFYGEVTQVTKA